MSYASSAFRLLGLAETDDVRAIKRAYAAKLKAINPDEDVAGFLALRTALETATGYARYLAERAAAIEVDGDSDEYYDDDEDGYEDDDARPIRRFIRPAPSASADGEDAPQSPPQWDAEAEMATLSQRPPTAAELFIASLEAEAEAYPDRQPLDAEASDGLLAAFQNLLADPTYETVDGQEDLERWLAHVLPQFAPWSDGLIWRASYHFGWEAELDKAQSDWSLAYAAQRARDVGVVVNLLRPDDPSHAAFMALTLPPEESAAEGQSVVTMRETITAFQFHNPAILQRFDPETLAYWSQLKPNQDCQPSRMFQWRGRSNLFFLFLTIALGFNLIIRVINTLSQ